APAQAQNQVTFKGAMQAHDTDSPGPGPGTVVVTTSGTGISTHFGLLSFTQQVTVNFASSSDTGPGQWTAANGDTIYTAITGSGELTDTPNVIRITEIHIITGGTGRFAGAQGSFVVERLANGVTFVTFGSFHGTITTAAGAN